MHVQWINIACSAHLLIRWPGDDQVRARMSSGRLRCMHARGSHAGQSSCPCAATACHPPAMANGETRRGRNLHSFAVGIQPNTAKTRTNCKCTMCSIACSRAGQLSHDVKRGRVFCTHHHVIPMVPKLMHGSCSPCFPSERSGSDAAMLP
jgi:hypothetical protein